MDTEKKNKLRTFIKSYLQEHGDAGELKDDDSLFISARLDSLAMITLISFLEQTFGVNFGDVDFDVELIDSVNEIELFLDGG
ncbi:phosphopantetheine-binding protein [Candidatus Magnetominusculus dajiuhuensis]|uniref:phosphopantetheine-binding protein n=1 Tax=Candidatus Magnetominusculus dajiuhuensis TaxID=3137712 RepID=UPI0019F9DFF8|nr:acyl carrier protein [Nitrospirota bacterium]